MPAKKTPDTQSQRKSSKRTTRKIIDELGIPLESAYTVIRENVHGIILQDNFDPQIINITRMTVTSLQLLCRKWQYSSYIVSEDRQAAGKYKKKLSDLLLTFNLEVMRKEIFNETTKKTEMLRQNLAEVADSMMKNNTLDSKEGIAKRHNLLDKNNQQLRDDLNKYKRQFPEKVYDLPDFAKEPGGSSRSLHVKTAG